MASHGHLVFPMTVSQTEYKKYKEDPHTRAHTLETVSLKSGEKDIEIEEFQEDC